MPKSTIESVCRVICEAEGVDPDASGVGVGNLMPEGSEYPLWKAREKVARALIDKCYIDEMLTA